MGGQQNLGSPSGSFLGSSPGGAFPQAPQAAPGSSIFWQQIAPKLLYLFNQPSDTAAAMPPTTTTTEPPAMGMAQDYAKSFNAAQDVREQMGQGTAAWDPNLWRTQLRQLDVQLKKGATPDPSFLQSLLDSGAIDWSPGMGWMSSLPRNDAQNERLVKAMDAFADYLDSKGLPNPQKVLPTIGSWSMPRIIGQLPPPPQGVQ
jgi:hypothetical protein